MRDDEGNSPLDVAIRENNLGIALFLFTYGRGSVEDKNKVFIQACHSHKPKMVKELVELHNVNPKGELLYYLVDANKSDAIVCYCLPAL